MSRKADVTVVEQAGGVQEHFKDQHACCGNAYQGNNDHLDSHGKKDLNGVKAHASCYVKIEVRMMHHMQAPQDWQPVKHHMLQINDKIENDHADCYLHP